MMKRLLAFMPRLLLVVLLATFLSPSFAWQTVVRHSGLAHADLGVVADDDFDHHHDGEVHHRDHDDAAHGQMGHLLSHLPVIMPESAPMLSPTVTRIAYPARHDSFAHAEAEPPFKPPRSLLFA